MGGMMVAMVRRADGVRDFAEAARQLCALLDEKRRDSKELWRELARRLAELCALALKLPAGEPGDMEARREPRHADPVFRDDHFLVIFDPFGDDREPVTGSLGDAIGDIRQDLATGLAHFDAGEIDAAAWEWRFGFYSHWGEHATSALRALYWLLRHTES
jgi:hypothetical protein